MIITIVIKNDNHISKSNNNNNTDNNNGYANINLKNEN